MSPPAVSALIRVLVVDDERIARQNLMALLSKDPEVEVVGECATGAQAVEALRRSPPEVLFLDVELAGTDGFHVLREARPERLAVIFVTAYDAYALKAFEARALDYLLKPFDDERFGRVLARAKEHVRGGRIQTLASHLAGLMGPSSPPPSPLSAAPAPPPAHYLERLALKDIGRVTFLAVDEVDWLKAEDYYVQVHAGEQTHLVRQSLRELEMQLDPRQFVRIHRSVIVNVQRVKELRPLVHGEYQVILRNGTHLKLSRSYRERLDALLGRV
ncbi:LytR/AlgR family response regulator transcription factor [Hyalangium versicolor]|uniref:LytR/AlgR family response regulator transcription factor n=1 Tax=Hyalangium versicolor TaxID=2861190 RepID=UPI001CCEB0CD|nr:LytTR family DNA-binding domain-containing protein [Hyalangium versicolor]